VIITDDFVMINFPKTGSTFARSILKEVHKRQKHGNNRSFIHSILQVLGVTRGSQLIELMLPNIDKQNDLGRKDQHGTLRQIPVKHRYKTVVSITRNPFDRYISMYLYGWWKDHPMSGIENVEKVFPTFPNLSFEEYYEMLHRFGKQNRLNGISPSIELGFHTIQFIQFYFRKPASVFQRINEDYISQKKYLKDMGEVTFLHQERLNNELFNFLREMGYPKEDIDFILKKDRINVTASGIDSNEVCHKRFYTDSLLKRIFNEDRLLFDLFPEYRDFYYKNIS
jgi:hypothetical protein